MNRLNHKLIELVYLNKVSIRPDFTLFLYFLAFMFLPAHSVGSSNGFVKLFGSPVRLIAPLAGKRLHGVEPNKREVLTSLSSNLYQQKKGKHENIHKSMSDWNLSRCCCYGDLARIFCGRARSPANSVRACSCTRDSNVGCSLLIGYQFIFTEVQCPLKRGRSTLTRRAFLLYVYIRISLSLFMSTNLTNR